MELRSYPGCCGASVIVGFGAPTDKSSVLDYKYHPKEPMYRCQQAKYLETTNDQEFTKTMERFKKREEEARRYSTRSGKVINAVLNDIQLTRWEGHWPKRLKEEGFVPVCRWFNSSGSLCTMFQRTSLNAERELSEIPNWSE